MPITYNTYALEGLRKNTGQTDGNEVIYQLNAALVYIVECIPTVAGTASMKVMTGDQPIADFTEMSVANDGTQSVNFIRRVAGCSAVGLDVSSGTWSVKVRRV